MLVPGTSSVSKMIYTYEKSKTSSLTLVLFFCLLVGNHIPYTQAVISHRRILWKQIGGDSFTLQSLLARNANNFCSSTSHFCFCQMQTWIISWGCFMLHRIILPMKHSFLLHYGRLFLDAISANCIFNFAETLSFCLEFLVFPWVIEFFLGYFKR